MAGCAEPTESSCLAAVDREKQANFRSAKQALSTRRAAGQFTRDGEYAAIVALCKKYLFTVVNCAANFGHGFCNVLFNHFTSPLEIRIMKIHLLVISAFLALTLSLIHI